MTREVALARGDGIGPEISEAVLQVLDAARVPLCFREITLGEAAGSPDGIEPEAISEFERLGVLLKAPLGTPLGSGLRSINVSLRQAFDLCVNLRPVRSLAPYVPAAHPELDLVVVRENSEDLYAGIEHRLAPGTMQALKLISVQGSERTIRYAFEWARANGRHKVTALAKPNIMKLTDGLFLSVFERIAAEYPELESEHLIVDIGMARVATAPERFDLIVTENLYGDILSDITGQLAGSVGLGGSANLGPHAAMFEAIHGTAPDIAGQDLANPTGMLGAALMMLAYLGLEDESQLIEAAWLRTLEDGVHTGDLAGPATVKRVGCQEFAQAICARLGEQPQTLHVARRGSPVSVQESARSGPVEPGTAGALDIFLTRPSQAIEALATELQAVAASVQGELCLIDSTGCELWPQRAALAPVGELLRARITSPEPALAAAAVWSEFCSRGLAPVQLTLVKA